MKTAISIPDPLFQSAEALASRMGLTRSELYTQAVESFIKTYDPSVITARLNELYSNENATIPRDLQAAQIALLDDEGW